MTRYLLIAALLPLLFIQGCQTVSRPPPPPPPTLEEIVQWSKDKVAPEEIILRIRQSRAVYPLSGSELADLKARGVSDRVIDYIHQRRIAAERYEEYLRTRQDYMFYGWPGYGPWGPWGPWGPGPYWYGPHRHW